MVPDALQDWEFVLERSFLFVGETQFVHHLHGHLSGRLAVHAWEMLQFYDKKKFIMIKIYLFI